MSTINYTYNVIVDRFRQFADGHFQLRRFTHGEISQADLEKEAEWPWMHVKPRAINYSPGTRAFSFEIFISDLPRDKEDKTGYQAESITDCSLIFQDLINEIHLGQMFGDDVLLTRPVNSEPFVEQYTHTLTGVTGIIELSLDYDWSACSIPASWNYNTPTNSPNDGFGALQFIESLHQDGVFVSLLNDLEAPGNSYYYGTNASGVKGWYAIVDNIGLTCETLPDCAVIISIVDDIAALQTDVALKANTADLGATAFSNDYNDLDNLPTIPAAQVNSDWNAVSGVAEILNKPTIPSIAGLVPETRTLTINGTTQDLSANRTFTIATGLTVGTTPITSGTVGRILFEGTGNVLQEDSGLSWNNTAKALNITSASTSSTPFVRLISNATTDFGGVSIEAPSVVGAWPLLRVSAGGVTAFQVDGARKTTIQSAATASMAIALSVPFGRVAFESDVASGSVPLLSLKNNGAIGTVAKIDTGASFATGWILLDVLRNGTSQFTILAGGNTLVKTGNLLIGTTTDAGYKLDVNGSVRTTGSISAASAVARGTYLNQTLVATANNDVLVGLDIQPTFTTGAFTGVQSIALRLPNGGRITNASTISGYNVYVANGETTLNSPSSTGTVGFQLSYGFVGRFMGTTGNFILQNGGTFTDVASSRLTINSTTQGFLPPRMTNAQRLAIATPAVGLIVYCTDVVEGLYINKSTGWTFII